VVAFIVSHSCDAESVVLAILVLTVVNVTAHCLVTALQEV